MSRRILDTSILISWWRRKGGEGPLETLREDPRTWAAELLAFHRARGIVSPVHIEFVCGMRDAARLALAETFLAGFDVLDGWSIRPDDLAEALKIARWIPADAKPRQFGDCLIAAIARRLRCEVYSLDKGFPR